MANFDLLWRHGGSVDHLKAAIEADPELRAYANDELASIDPSLLERDYATRQYVTALRHALGLSSETLEQVETAHQERMREIMAKRDGRTC